MSDSDWLEFLLEESQEEDERRTIPQTKQEKDEAAQRARARRHAFQEVIEWFDSNDDYMEDDSEG